MPSAHNIARKVVVFPQLRPPVARTTGQYPNFLIIVSNPKPRSAPPNIPRAGIKFMPSTVFKAFISLFNGLKLLSKGIVILAAIPVEGSFSVGSHISPNHINSHAEDSIKFPNSKNIDNNKSIKVCNVHD